MHYTMDTENTQDISFEHSYPKFNKWTTLLPVKLTDTFPLAFLKKMDQALTI